MWQVRLFLFFLLTCLLVACEKPILTDDESLITSNLRLNVYQLEHTPFSMLTRSTVSEVCTHLNFAVYDMEGARQKQINQKVGDSDFGTASFELKEGSYQMVALAHSSSKNPTMTNPAKIQFSNSQGYSDTFLYYTTITIGDEPQNLSLSLRRIVALCRFIINDAVPEGITRLEFTYKGGSGHFDAKTGLGVTNSTQVANFNVEAGYQQTQYDLYTFLHNTEGTIHLKVVAYDAKDNPQHEREFDVPMEQNTITWLTGDFFTGITFTTSQSVATTITIGDAWTGEQHLTY